MAAYNEIGSQLKTTVATLTAAQMNTSFATPITILPKSGANVINVVDRVILKYKAESASAVSSGNATVVRYKSGSTIASQDFSSLTASTIYYKEGSVTTFTSTQANVDIEIGTLVANPTFYGTVEVTIEYRELRLN